jgi:uncharacterized protein (DUF305 family)
MPPRAGSTRPAPAWLALLVAPLLLTACAGAGEPGAEGTAPTVIAAEDVSDQDEVMFLMMMIPHHGQALEMAQLAEERADDDRVRDLAARIAAAQGPEIRQMQDWLRASGHPVPDATSNMRGGAHGDHSGHGGMDGMLTEQEMQALRAARGHDFDHLFLEGMIAHHQGAVEMGRVLLDSGRSSKVADLARTIDREQRAEIREMRALKEELSEHPGH